MKSFTQCILANGLRNVISNIMLLMTPIGWVCYFRSAMALVGRWEALRLCLNPLWMITLSNLLVKKVRTRAIVIYGQKTLSGFIAITL